MSGSDGPRIVALEKEIRILRKKLARSEADRVAWEGMKDQADALYQSVIDDLETTKVSLTEAFGVISSSIDYASRIQRSILPHRDSFSTVFSDHFIIWEPRDRVGGDIYWNRIWGDGVLVVLADSTGHGVPGAFMTLIATGALDRAQEEVSPGDVGKLLQRIHQRVQLTLGQHMESGESDDGLELGACYLDAEQTNMTFTGARFSLFIDDGRDVAEIKGDKNGIGYRGIPYDQAFTNQRVKICPEHSFYLSTDGLTDQVGGEHCRMFGKKRFRKLISSLRDKTFAEQKVEILQALSAYQGDESRRDDVSIVGFKVG
jgi:serine phosphatase RsbU (regulator of sigma subunit)